MTYETLLLAVAGPVATLTLNRPDSRNALNLRMCDELLSAINALAADDAVRVVLIRANGPAFCAGADLKERKGMNAEDTRARRLKAFAAYAAIENLPQPAIAVVEGPCMGSGCEIAAACDFILAGSGASFRYPEVGWGTVGATQRLPRIVGKSMAKELLLTGRLVDAAEAKAMGLVNHVLETAALEAFVADIAQKIASAPPMAARLAKRCLDQGMDTGRAGALAIELRAIEENLAKSDWKQNIAGFAEKKRSGDKPVQ
ncbi:MAG: enoyl-CoA hydratase/isomerase family protein [Betaproteobacteria bacterium]|nr:enoyl-CoA hydratase/isomerase family protein [Betaproteobacteria bacterium]